MSATKWLQVRVEEQFKKTLLKITGKRGMSKFVIKAIEEKIERLEK